MARRSGLEFAQRDIFKLFDERQDNVFRQSQLSQILSENSYSWQLPASTTIRRFIKFLTEEGKLKKHRFAFPHQAETRYAWDNRATIYDIVSTFRSNGYFSHLSALYLHKLVDGYDGFIYFNSEQKPHPRYSTRLSQGGIDSAFKRKQRQTTNFVKADDYTIYLLNGKNTKRLGVIEVTTPEGTFDCTNIERTLVDVVVRPNYSGGLANIIIAYKEAKGRVSTNKMVAYLRELDHAYPYHQSVGFLLEHTGYPGEVIDLFQKLPRDYDFYLTHQMKEPTYNSKWKLFVPKELA